MKHFERSFQALTNNYFYLFFRDCQPRNKQSCQVWTPLANEHHDYVLPDTEKPPLEEYYQNALQRIEELEKELTKLKVERFGLQRFGTDDDMIRFYTGFRSYKLLCSFIRLIHPSAQTMKTWQQVQRQRVSGKSGNTPTDFNQHALIIEDQIFMFLCKIRQAFFVLDLADRFKVSISSVSRYLITWANFLYFTLGVIPIWPSKEMVIAFMPDCFKQEYPSTRVILDC